MNEPQENSEIILNNDPEYQEWVDDRNKIDIQFLIEEECFEQREELSDN